MDRDKPVSESKSGQSKPSAETDEAEACSTSITKPQWLVHTSQEAALPTSGSSISAADEEEKVISSISAEQNMQTPEVGPSRELPVSPSHGQKQASAFGTSHSLPASEIFRDNILTRAGSAPPITSSSGVLGKVNTTSSRDTSIRFLEDLKFRRGQLGDHGQEIQDSEDQREISENTPLMSPLMPFSPVRSKVSSENEKPVRMYREVQLDLRSIEGLKHAVKRAWTSFINWHNRRTLKKIKASLHVLRTYHDAILHGEVPLNLQAKIRLRTGWIGFFWHVTEFWLGVISAALYVYSTYHSMSGTNNLWVERFQRGISFAFLVDYVFRLFTETSRFYYIFSFWGGMDLLSLIPVILLAGDDIKGAEFLKLLHFIRIVRIFGLINKSHVGRSLQQQIILLSLGTFGVIFLDAGIIQWIEYWAMPEAQRQECPRKGCLSFWQAFYFMIVTVGTVGFGDITAKTVPGQFLMCVTILTALIVIPLRVGKITNLAFLSPYGGSINSRKLSGSRFLILSGGLSLVVVQNFLAEFYKRTHRQEYEAYPLRVVILGPHRPSFELKQLLLQYHGKAEFVQGSPLRSEDLERAKAHQALAILLVANPDANSASVEDSAQTIRALAVHRFCRSRCSADHRIRLIVEVLNPATKRSAVWDGKYIQNIEVICPTKIHYKLMAPALSKGLYTLITNLFTSELRLKHLDERDFISEYFNSFDNEIYPVILPQAFLTLTFEQVAEIILEKFNSTLLGLDTSFVCLGESHRVKREVLLFPRDRRIRSDDVGLVITNDLKIAHAISCYDPKVEEGSKTGNIALRLWKTLVNIGPENESSVEDVRLLPPEVDRRHRKGNLLSRAAVALLRDFKFGFRFNEVYPEDRDSEVELEDEFKEAIREAYGQEGSSEWRNSTTSSKQGSEDVARAENADKWDSIASPDFRFPRGMSLEKAAERLLAWPPVIVSSPPHPAVLERREQDIVHNLSDRTLTLVTFPIPHVLVCCQQGWPANIFYFLKGLRNPTSANPPIVILYPEMPTSGQWGSAGMFDNVFFLRGSPKYELDLMRAGVLQAARIVILAMRGEGESLEFSGSGDMEDRFTSRSGAAHTIDIENIVVAANVQRLYGSRVVDKLIVELKHGTSFHYLRPHYEIPFSQFKRWDVKRNREGLVHFGPPYMEGKATSLSMLGFFLRAIFLNRNTARIVDQLIKGGFGYTDSGSLTPDRQRFLAHIEVPPGCAHKTYHNLFMYLLHERSTLAIGLYRVRGTLGAPTSYVLTNPRKGSIVNPDDLVYVIS